MSYKLSFVQSFKNILLDFWFPIPFSWSHKPHLFRPKDYGSHYKEFGRFWRWRWCWLIYSLIMSIIRSMAITIRCWTWDTLDIFLEHSYSLWLFDYLRLFRVSISQERERGDSNYLSKLLKTSFQKELNAKFVKVINELFGAMVISMGVWMYSMCVIIVLQYLRCYKSEVSIAFRPQFDFTFVGSITYFFVHH